MLPLLVCPQILTGKGPTGSSSMYRESPTHSCCSHIKGNSFSSLSSKDTQYICISPWQHSSHVSSPIMSATPVRLQKQHIELKFLLFAPCAACVSVHAFQRGTQLSWFPRKSVRASLVMLSSWHFLIWVQMLEASASPVLLILRSRVPCLFRLPAHPPLPHLTVGCHFHPPSLPVSISLYQVHQSVGKDGFVLLSQLGSHLFPTAFDPHKGCQVIKPISLSLTPAVQSDVDAEEPSTVSPFPLTDRIKDKTICVSMPLPRVTQSCSMQSPGSSIGVHLEEQQGLTIWGLNKSHQSLHSIPDLSLKEVANPLRQQFRSVDGGLHAQYCSNINIQHYLLIKSLLWLLQ